MELLLDTHVFLWWTQENVALNGEASGAIADGANNIYVSAASIWEIAIKRRAGKLKFSRSAAATISANGFFDLPILPADAEAAGLLDWDHKDPFDRMLIAQAIRSNATLITADKLIYAYQRLSLLWAG